MTVRLHIALTDEQARWIEQAVASGAYASASELLREALRDWRQRRRPEAPAPTPPRPGLAALRAELARRRAPPGPGAEEAAPDGADAPHLDLPPPAR